MPKATTVAKIEVVLNFILLINNKRCQHKPKKQLVKFKVRLVGLRAREEREVKEGGLNG